MPRITHRAMKLSLIISALGTLIVMLGLVAPAPAHADNAYYQAQNTATGKCLDQDYSNPGNGATVQMWDCWGGPNQQWALQNCDWLGRCEIVNLWSGKCLDANAGGLTSNGDRVQVWDCWGGANQYWYAGFPDGSTGHWQVINKADGKCLDADASNYNNGERVQLWDCWYTTAYNLIPAPNQTWYSPGGPPI